MKRELPSVKPKELVKALGRYGFLLKRQTGSHAILYKSGVPHPISVPIHTKELPKGTLRAIIRQANLTVDDFLKLLQ